MKKVSDATTAVGAGDGWFKVTDDGLIDGVFCTDRLRLANAPQPGNIPSGIAPGDYLMRAELLTLNNAGPTGARQPQFYAGYVTPVVIYICGLWGGGGEIYIYTNTYTDAFK